MSHNEPGEQQQILCHVSSAKPKQLKHEEGGGGGGLRSGKPESWLPVVPDFISGRAYTLTRKKSAWTHMKVKYGARESHNDNWKHKSGDMWQNVGMQGEGSAIAIENVRVRTNMQPFLPSKLVVFCFCPELLCTNSSTLRRLTVSAVWWNDASSPNHKVERQSIQSIEANLSTLHLSFVPFTENRVHDCLAH